MFRADGGRPVASGPATRHRPVLPLGQRLITREPVGAFPARLFAKDGSQFFQSRINRTETQLTCAATFPHGIANVVVGAIDFVDARSDVAAAGGIGPETSHIHLPQVKPRLAIDNPVRHHLAHASRTRDAMRAEPAGRPEPLHLWSFA